MTDPADRRRFPKIGLRNLKTALAVTLCALIYLVIGRNPTFACIGAVFGLGCDMQSSRLHGGNRFFGTVIGGFLGMGLFRVYLCFRPDGRPSLALLPLLAVGVIVLILLSILLWPGAVQPGGVVLSILLYNSPVDGYVGYALNRMLDTGVGVAMALFINYLLPRERLENWLAQLRDKRRNSFSTGL